MKWAEIPALPKEMMALKADPPGTAFTGLLSLKIISKTVSPIPMTLRIRYDDCLLGCKYKGIQ